MADRIREMLKNQGVGFTREAAKVMAARNNPIKNLKCKATVKTVKKTPVVLPKTVLNQVRDGMREASRGLGSLFFEARVTTNHPFVVGSATHGAMAKTAGLYGFRFEGDDLVFSSIKLERVKEELAGLQQALVTNGYKIWRYRISEVMMDSNNFDTLKLL